MSRGREKKATSIDISKLLVLINSMVSNIEKMELRFILSQLVA
jgi:hypothetical protein